MSYIILGESNTNPVAAEIFSARKLGLSKPRLEISVKRERDGFADSIVLDWKDTRKLLNHYNADNVFYLSGKGLIAFYNNSGLVGVGLNGRIN